MPHHIGTTEVLGIVQVEREIPRKDPNLIEDTVLSDLWNAGKTPTTTDLDFSHVPDAYREPLRKMPLKYDYVWDGLLGEINVVKDSIDLNPG